MLIHSNSLPLPDLNRKKNLKLNLLLERYQQLISDLGFDASQLIEFIKAKLVRDYNPQNLTISISGIENQ